MTTEQFYYWLQGFFELSEAKVLTEKQVYVIKEHMALVAEKKTNSEFNTDFKTLPTCLSC